MVKFAEDVSKEVVYDVPWQVLRVQLLAKNSEKGGFNTLEGVKENIRLLKDYVGNATDINKVYQALNLLNAARMGFASKDEIGDDKDKILVSYRDSLDETYQELKGQGKELSSVSEEQVKKDLKNAPLDWLIEVQRDLKSREKVLDPEEKHEILDKFLKVLDTEIESKTEKESSIEGNIPMISAADLRKIATELEEITKTSQGVKSLTEIIREMAELIHDSLDSDMKIDAFSPGAIQEALVSLGLDKTPGGKKLIQEFEKSE